MRSNLTGIVKEEAGIIARHPPQNLVNALRQTGPRDRSGPVFTATYNEPPFLLEEDTSAYRGLKNYAEYIQKGGNTGPFPHLLGELRFIYQEMGNRGSCSDPFLQFRAKIALKRL